MTGPIVFIFGRMAEGTTAVFAFWPTLTYFCDCDTHFNNALRPPSAYTAVVCLPTTAALIVLVLVLASQVHALPANCNCHPKARVRFSLFPLITTIRTYSDELSVRMRTMAAIREVKCQPDIDSH